MLTQINCIRNNGYKWYSSDNCKFKGYLQKENGVVIRDYEAVKLLSSIQSYEALFSFLRQCMGVFSLILSHGNEVWLATDIARSMPLYYTEDGSYVSDDVNELQKVCNPLFFGLEDFRTIEMYATSYIGYQNTIFRGIKQVELGSVTKIKEGMITTKPYFIHHKDIQLLITEKEAVRLLKEKTKNMIKRILKVVGNRQIVISLSGGYDSRYLACSLKDFGVDNVICYTYGRSDSFEVAQSKKVADALGYQWFNIPYTDVAIRNILKMETDYLDYCNRPDYSAYLQNYIAVKTLHNKKLIPEDSVFLTGLCNDMPTGAYIPDEKTLRNKYAFTNEGVATYNVDGRFTRFNITAEAKAIFKKDVVDYLDRMCVSVHDYQSFVSALDCLETSLSHSHCFLNMNTVHEFFGYEWLLPCWDKELLSFWYSLPANLRKGQKFYEIYITQHLANRYGVGTKKYINSLASKPWKVKLKRKIGGLAVSVLYPLGIPVRRNTDINNFSVLEVEIYKQLKQKCAVKSERASIVLMGTIYMMERRYGTNWYANIRKYLV